MPPFPNISRIGLTFDLDLSPTDLNIDRGHLFIKDFLPTKFGHKYGKSLDVGESELRTDGRMTQLL